MDVTDGLWSFGRGYGFVPVEIILDAAGEESHLRRDNARLCLCQSTESKDSIQSQKEICFMMISGLVSLFDCDYDQLQTARRHKQ